MAKAKNMAKKRKNKSSAKAQAKQPVVSTPEPAIKQRTELVILLDRTGSMQGTKWVEAVSGLNTMVEDQRKLPGQAFLTLLVFDRYVNEPVIQLIYDRMPIAEVPKFDAQGKVQPRGGTPLWDAIVATVGYVRGRVADLPKDQKPDGVFLNILTDGLNNESRENTEASAKKVLDECRAQDWLVTMSAVGIDEAASIQMARAVGIGAEELYMSADADVAENFAATSKRMATYRSNRN